MSENYSGVRFNYIITIHNKQDLIKDVMLHVLQCMGSSSVAIPVLDGCNDGSEGIIDEIIKLNPGKQIKKVYASDVHELKAINAGVRASDQTGIGYNIVLQDDVLIRDTDIENKVARLYSEKSNLGIVSFRHGANLSRSLLAKKESFMPFKDHIESVKGHNYDPFSVLQLGSFTYREIAIKSPICIPFKVVNTVGLPDEIYAPWDDIAYCYSVTEAGFDNGVYAIDFESDVLWGTTRKKKQQLGLSVVEHKNIGIFKQKNAGKLQKNKMKPVYDQKIFRIDSNVTSHRVTPVKFLKACKAHVVKELRYYKNILFSK